MKIDKEYARRVALAAYQNDTHDMLEAYLRGIEAAMKKAGLMVVAIEDYVKTTGQDPKSGEAIE